MNKQLALLQKNYLEYYSYTPQQRIDLNTWPIGEGVDIIEQRRISSLISNVERQVLKDSMVLHMAMGLKGEPKHNEIWVHCVTYVIQHILYDLDALPEEGIFEPGEKNSAADLAFSTLRHYLFMIEGRDWAMVAQLTDIVKNVANDWYYSHINYTWLSDDGYDYFQGACQNLIWLSEMITLGEDRGTLDLEKFHLYLKEAGIDELVDGPNLTYPKQASDGDPRYGLLFKIYCESHDIETRED